MPHTHSASPSSVLQICVWSSELGGSPSGKDFHCPGSLLLLPWKAPLSFEGLWSHVTFLRAGSLPIDAKATVRALYSVGEQKMMSVSS